MIDERIADAYRGVTLDKDSAARIWSALERELPPGKENRPVKTMRNPLRVALIAAVLSVLMIGTAYAAFAVPRWTGTWRRGGEAEYTELAALGQVEKTVGYPVAAVQEFENGYVFQRMRVDGEAVFAEDNSVLREYYGVHLYYEKPGAPGLSVSVSPELELPGGAQPPEPSETRIVGGTEVRCSFDRYKIVPENYEKTEADLAAEKAGHFYISFGSDAVEEHDYSFASFTLGGAEYTIMADEPLDAETLYAMAGEILAQS